MDRFPLPLGLDWTGLDWTEVDIYGSVCVLKNCFILYGHHLVVNDDFAPLYHALSCSSSPAPIENPPTLFPPSPTTSGGVLDC